MMKGYKFRIYPNKTQRTKIEKTFGCVRFIYNKMLTDKIEYYRLTKKKLKNTPAQYKAEFEWLKDVDSLALANAQMNLQDAYERFFKDSKVGYPKFRSKKYSKKSYTTNCVNGNIIIRDGMLKLPKVGLVKMKQHRKIPDYYKLKAVTVSRNAGGKYFASIRFEYDDSMPEKDTQKSIGLECYLQELYIDSNGYCPKFPEYYRNSERKLKRELRKLTNMEKCSKNREKQRIRVAKLREKLTNQRNDFLHKLSRQITNVYDCVWVNHSDAAGQTQGFDNGWGTFTIFLRYKLEETGKRLIKVDESPESYSLYSVNSPPIAVASGA